MDIIFLLENDVDDEPESMPVACYYVDEWVKRVYDRKESGVGRLLLKKSTNFVRHEHFIKFKRLNGTFGYALTQQGLLYFICSFDRSRLNDSRLYDNALDVVLNGATEEYSYSRGGRSFQELLDNEKQNGVNHANKKTALLSMLEQQLMDIIKPKSFSEVGNAMKEFFNHLSKLDSLNGTVEDVMYALCGKLRSDLKLEGAKMMVEELKGIIQDPIFAAERFLIGGYSQSAWKHASYFSNPQTKNQQIRRSEAIYPMSRCFPEDIEIPSLYPTLEVVKKGMNTILNGVEYKKN